jgi:DNA replication ATP-dependent helicase Dna2
MRNASDNPLKKLKIDCKSSISFWSDTNKDNFENEVQMAESELSFTSAEIAHQVETNKSQNIKFIIRNIVESDESLILEGDDVICKVSGEWCSVNYEVNTKITVMSCLCCDEELIKNIEDDFIHVSVNDTTNYLFIEDDLMTITNLISSIRCINNPYLNNKIADIGFNFSDKCLVNGIILHEVMQNCLLSQNYNLSFIMTNITKGINDNLMNIYCCDTTEKIVKDDLLSVAKNIMSFNKHNLIFEECEKRIASLNMNLKGNVDAVGYSNVLEIKSGKSMDVSHKAQAILYSLILKEKYKKAYQPFLYYISSNNFIKCDIRHSEVKSLMILRNKLSLSTNISNCDCSDFDSCKIIQNILNLPDTHWLKIMWTSLNKEENYRLKETWHFVKFKKQVDLMVVFVYDNTEINVDDVYINIYTEDLVKLCKGVISKVDNMFLHVSLSEKINLEKDSGYYISFGSNDVFFKFMRFSLLRIAYFRYLEKETKFGFRLPGEEYGLNIYGDEDSLFDFSSDEIKMAFIDNKKDNNTKNLENTSSLDNMISSSIDKQINFVIDNTSSSFVYFTPPPPPLTKYKYQIPDIYMTQFLKLNENQKSALYSSLNCENYKIIHGMPGTGKSSVITLLIKILVNLNKKILLVCYTNLAITNILNKLKTIRSYRARKENTKFTSVNEIKTYFKNIDLVASTCFGFRDPIFLERSFDYCIIDEGSQQHLLLTLIPISLCKKFIIFGDHLQLKPLSKSSTELSTSLFEYLLDNNHSELSIQYRMGPNIMRLSNELFYNNKLKLGRNIDDSVIFIDSSTINYDTFIREIKDSTILCYLNSQVKKTKELTTCQVETVDRFQGSEDDNIIVVFDPVIKCDVLGSRERLNVALTRARKKLILIGDLFKMREIEILNKLLEIMNVC